MKFNFPHLGMLLRQIFREFSPKVILAYELADKLQATVLKEYSLNTATIRISCFVSCVNLMEDVESETRHNPM